MSETKGGTRAPHTPAIGVPAAARLRPDHAGISVADLEASIAWYGDMLGFAVDRVVDVPGDAGRVALVRKEGFILELFCVPGAAPLPDERRHPATDLRTHGIKHVAYAVPNIGALMEELKGKGVDVVWDVVEHDNTLCAFVRDNSGNLVEFVERHPFEP
jgi:catechol 2,3-dioxygenase-like lactoylglutathione lyase family enzyme